MGREPDERDNEQSELGNLGSLAQSARLKNLNTARWVMIVVGILTIAVNMYLLVTARQQLLNEIHKKNMVVVDQAAFESGVRLVQLIAAVPVVLGVVFIILGILVKKFPVPMTITGLVLYIAATLIFGLLEPASLVQGLIIKIVIVVALIKAVQAALAYEREKVTTLYEPD